MITAEDFLKRLKRHAQTASSLGGIATQFLMHKDADHRSVALQNALGNLKGPVMKIGQILSTIPDMIPQEYVQALSTLQSKAPPMGWLFVKRRLRAELGENWESLFQDFQKDASAAASLGQVHKAMSLEGTALAVKIQYPDMDSIVEADLGQLQMLLKIYEKSQGGIHTEDILLEIGTHLRQELDYQQEARFLNAFSQFFEAHPAIRIPKTFPKLSTSRLLTMTWQEGVPFTNFENAPEEQRNHLAKTLFWAWYSPFYQAGLLHGDPHLGNYTASSDGTVVNLLDFGCVRVFDPSFIEGVLVLYEALKSQNLKKTADAYELWGFKNLSFELIEILNLWASYLYDPLLDDCVRFIHPNLSTQQGQAIARTIHEKLKAMGGLAPPKTFVFMDRAAVGLGAVFLRLKARLNWYELFQEIIQDFSIEAISSKQRFLLESKSPFSLN